MNRNKRIREYIVQQLRRHSRYAPDLTEELEKHLVDLIEAKLAKGFEEEAAFVASVAELGSLAPVRRHLHFERLRAAVRSSGRMKAVLALLALMSVSLASYIPLMFVGGFGWVETVQLHQIPVLAVPIYLGMCGVVFNLFWSRLIVRIAATVLSAGAALELAMWFVHDWSVSGPAVAGAIWISVALLLLGIAFSLLSLWLKPRTSERQTACS